MDNINLLVSVNIQSKRHASGNVLKRKGRYYRLSLKVLSYFIHSQMQNCFNPDFRFYSVAHFLYLFKFVITIHTYTLN